MREFSRPCAIIADSWSGQVVGGKSLGLQTEIDSELFLSTPKDATAHMGFSLLFPFGPDNENQGFGVCHKYDSTTDKSVLATSLEVRVEMPAGQYQICFKDLDSIAGIKGQFLNGKEMTAVEITLDRRHNVTVRGYGNPFSNPGHPCDGWLNKNLPINNGITLLDLFEMRKFHIIVLSNSIDAKRCFGHQLPGPFCYPYGDRHWWRPNKYNAMLSAIERKGPFARAINFEDDNARLAVLTQAVIQDTLWLSRAAATIFATQFPAYFVPAKKRSGSSLEHDTYFAIIQLTKKFRLQYKAEWEQLTDCESFKLAFFRHNDSIVPPPLSRERFWHELARETWDAVLVQNAKNQPALAHHLGHGSDFLFLEIRRDKSVKMLPTFPTCTAAIDSRNKDSQSWSKVSLLFDPQLKECQRKVNAICQFHPEARPSHQPAVLDTSTIDLETRMKLHRALQRGRGFHDLFREYGNKPAEDIVTRMESFHINEGEVTSLVMPFVNFWAGVSPRYLEALLQNFLPADRDRIKAYLRNCPLGLVIFTAGPGFAKTTALAVTTLLMRVSQGRVYGSAPSNVAVDNFAERLQKIDQEAIKRANEGKPIHSATRLRRTLIVRGYSLLDEIVAFRKLVESPKAGDKAAPKREWKPKSKWKLELSTAYWLLMVLRSPAVRSLEPDDSLALHDLQKRYDGDTELDGLRDIIAGNGSWSDVGVDFKPDEITRMMGDIVGAADILLTTPAKSTASPYFRWKQKACGVAVDEAANITRPDLDCVWGNVLLPCVLAGDEHQLRPTVKTEHQRDKNGKYINRHHADGIMSPLEFFKMNGWPVLRLRVQFRMAKGQFDICHRELYSDLPFEYAECCAITSDAHRIGNQLEDYAASRFPSLTQPPSGKLTPIFIHCRGSKRERPRGRFAMSSQNDDQNRVALEFLVGFVRASKTNPARICLITPYKANAHAIEHMRKKGDYHLLKGMPAAATVDSFQGREGDIVVTVMVSTKESGPGFMTCENRLDVLLSRHKSGLVIVGDINVAEDLIDDSNGMAKATTLDHVKSNVMLSNVCSGLVEDGRVVVVESKQRVGR